MIIFTILVMEVILRFTYYKYLIRRADIPRYYFKADDAAGYDIVENFPRKEYISPDGRYILWSNELGCFDRPFNAEKKYILLAGDSFTWGFAPFECRFSTLIENYLEYRILNCGVMGYGTKQELLKIRKIIGKIGISPTLIILAYCLENDFLGDWLSPWSTVIDGYLVEKQKIVNYQTGERKVISDEELRKQLVKETHEPNLTGLTEKIKFWLSRNSILYTMVTQTNIVRMLGGKLGFLTEPYIPMFEQVDKLKWLRVGLIEHFRALKAIKELSDRNKAKLLVIIIPPKWEVYDFGVRRNNLGKLREILVSFFNEEKIGFFDITLPFQEFAKNKSKRWFYPKEKLYWQFGGHFSITGNKLASILISRYILNNNLIEVSGLENKRKKIEKELEMLKK